MIERPVRPARRSMTGAAIGAELPVVPVFTGVAADAGGRRSDIAAPGMAIGALRRGVRPFQRKRAAGVVEGDVVPSVGRVALGAVHRKLALVSILLEMAGAALHPDPDPLAIDVTLVAFQSQVLPG